MTSTSGTGVEIRKFDGKNFALWKEMMYNVPASNQGNTTQQQANLDDNRRMVLTGRK